MTLVGHTLTGAAIGVAVLPRRSSRVRTTIQVLVFMVLANFPDLPIGDWGHGLYYFSHSIFSNLVLIALTALMLTVSRRVLHLIGGWPVVAGGALAWSSHLLLDALYNNPKGYGMFWPFSTAHFALPIPWFYVMYGGLLPVTPGKIHILLVEAVCYLPLLILAILVRRLRALEWPPAGQPEDLPRS